MITLRQEILAQLPELDLSQGRPLQVLWFVGLIPVVILLSAAVVASNEPAWARFGLSILLGLGYSSLGLFGHELLHGSILKSRSPFSRFAVRVMAWFCFLIFGLSPELWLTWHNRVHHFHTNESGIDPDSFGLWSDFTKYPMQDFLLARSPGSKHWLGWVYLPINFNNQVLSVWYLALEGDPGLFRTVNRNLAWVETALMYVFWILIAVKLGWGNMLWLFLLPMMIANLVVSSYILVQHLLCPLSAPGAPGDPLENTLGIEMLRGFENLHFHFGYHVEHHIFPELNHVHFSKLRDTLRRMYPTRYRLMGHVQALKLLLNTPRVYKDAETLFDPQSGLSVNLSDFGRG